MKTIRILVPVLLLATAGLAQDVRYNYAAGQDFSKFKTYKWVQLKNADQLDQLADKQLKSTVDEELATKGLKETDGDNADLYIAYQVSLRQEKQFTTYGTGTGWGPGPGWGRGWYGPGGGMNSTMSTTTSSTIPVGQLDLDMYDAANKDLVWRGTVSKTIDTKAKPDKQQKNMQKSVAKLLKNYPPPEKKNG
ncbi:MAG: DUF4136 domain-containing protein [Bryobacteraceae bacterium]